MVVALLSLAAQRQSFAGSAAWGSNPASGDWNTAANWMPNAVPNGPSDTATFGMSDVTNLSIDRTSDEVSSIVFNRGAPGGAIQFHDQTDGGTASFALHGNSSLDIGKHKAAATTIGSLAGRGTVYLEARTLAIGSNNRRTTFSGIIQDSGGIGQGSGGSLTKVGTGTLRLSGPNLYTGTTTVSAGLLQVANKSGSATGPGAVQVNAGALGGKGIIAGAVTVGAGNGAGAILQPSVGVSQTVTLSLQGALTFKADGAYTYKLNTQKAKADQVVANGVTIESGAQFNFTVLANRRLAAGTVFSAISNTAATPINGAFANLADGSTIAAGRNSLQVSYSGGDGNDLTLTVLP